MKGNITILVNSCDSYEDTWEPFFFLLHKYWEECPYEIILNTETKSFFMDGMNIKTLQLYKNKKSVCYGERMLEHLKYIDSDYVLLLMDDFFVRKKVSVDKIQACEQWLEKNPDVAVFSFENVKDDRNIDDGCFHGFELRPQVGEYKINLQAALWRKSSLMKYIKKHENPWQVEIKGSQRTFKSKDKFYVYKSGQTPIIDYGKTQHLDWGIVRGKWMIEDVRPLFEANNIRVNYSFRGYLKKSDIESMRTIPVKQSIIGEMKSIGILEWMKRSAWRGIRKMKQLLGYPVPKDYIEYLRNGKGGGGRV